MRERENIEKRERLYIREGAAIHKAAAIQNKVPQNRYFYTVPFEQRAKSVHNSDQNSNNGQKVVFSDHNLSNNYLNTGIVLDNGYLNTKIMLGCV